MRKIKKINGYLVVKVNDREKRDYEELGTYGVIDAELYTGHIDIDRGQLEYEDADSLDVAIEQARGLDAEEDLADEGTTFTIVTETSETIREEQVEPQLMIAGFQRRLQVEVKSIHHKDVDPRTAAHELYGYKVALNDLGVLEDDDTFVLPDTFGEWEYPTPLPKGPEELLAHICDEVCKERIPGRTQDELDAVCAKCAVERLADEADERELRIRSAAQREMNGLIHELRHESRFQERRISAAEARVYLRALVTTHTVTAREGEAFTTAINEAGKEPCAECSFAQDMADVKRLTHTLKEVDDYVKKDKAAPERDTLANLDDALGGSDAAKTRVVLLGKALEADCPDNDCRVYLNIFHMAQELDAAIDGLPEYPARTLKTELRKRYQELRQMYRENYAVQQYKAVMKA